MSSYLQSETLESGLARRFSLDGQFSVQRAVAELRAGRPVLLHANGDSLLVAAAEMLVTPTLTALGSESLDDFGLILSRHRLEHLGLATDTHGRISLSGLSLAEIEALLIGVKPTLPKLAGRRALPVESIALDLVRHTYMLPAAFVRTAQGDGLAQFVQVDAKAVSDFHDDSARALTIAARAPIPLADAEDAEIVVFRGGDGLREQVAIVVGEPNSAQPVLTRLHSACLTGDLLASLKCDCGEQLRRSIHAITSAGSGILLYLDQEGRGIGLVNKIRAYSLQRQGHDTLDADAILGYGPDERRYGIASAMLKLLGFSDILMLTNNPEKISALTNYGIRVHGHRRLLGSVNPHNEVYLTTKSQRAGHLLDKLGLRIAGE